MNVWDVAIVLLVAGALALALRSVWRARRKGGCACCSYAASCSRDSCEARHE